MIAVSWIKALRLEELRAKQQAKTETCCVIRSLLISSLA